MSECDVGPTVEHDVNNAIPQPLSKQDMACSDVPMERSQVSNKLRGLYLPGFIGGTRVMWLIDTGAARSILSLKMYNSLPASVKFSLSRANSAIALADGLQAKTHGLGHVVVCLGTKEFQMHVIVVEIEDEGILGVDFLSQADSHIDIVKNQVTINGEVFDCSDFKNQRLSPRGMVRRSTIIEPNTEVIVPVTVHKRSTNLNPKASQLGMRLLEPCLASHLQQKGLYVARTPVDVKEDRVVTLRVFNVSDEAYHLAAETVVAVAKPVIDVTPLELYEENQESVEGQARVINQHVSHEAIVERTLPEPLQELLQRSTGHLTDHKAERLQELPYNYQHVFSLSDRDLGTTHMVQHRIETDNGPQSDNNPGAPLHGNTMKSTSDK